MKFQSLHKNSVFDPKKTLRVKGNIWELHGPRIMGILNVNPDSFYDGGKYNSAEQALIRAEKMIKEGADIIDIGGMSSRPGAEIISEELELSRVMPVITEINNRFPKAIMSIDTIHAKVAKEAVQAGAAIVNDISAGKLDAQMIETVAMLQVPYIMMHMRGTPATMKQHCEYDDLLTDMLRYFDQRIQVALAAGIKDIILDPGFGFSKTLQQNFELLAKLDRLKLLEFPLLAGLSRKSMIWKSLDISPADALNGSTALHMLALQKGANFLRVHDVAQAKEVVTLFNLLSN